MFISTIAKYKSLKIPKGQSETVKRRRTDNTMAKRKKVKRTNNDLQNFTHKQSEAVNQRRTDNTMAKRTKRILSSSHHNVTCSCHDISVKLLILALMVLKQQSLTHSWEYFSSYSANILLQSKVKYSKSVETTSTVPVSSVFRIRDLYKAPIKEYTVTILKEGTKQSLIIAEKVLQTFQDTITEIRDFQIKFPEHVTREMEAVIISMMKSDSFENDYVYGFENLKPSYKMAISCVLSTLLCTLQIEKDFV